MLYLITIDFVKSKVTLQVNKVIMKNPYILTYIASNSLSEFKVLKIN